MSRGVRSRCRFLVLRARRRPDSLPRRPAPLMVERRSSARCRRVRAQCRCLAPMARVVLCLSSQSRRRSPRCLRLLRRSTAASQRTALWFRCPVEPPVRHQRGPQRLSTIRSRALISTCLTRRALQLPRPAWSCPHPRRPARRARWHPRCSPIPLVTSPRRRRGGPPRGHLSLPLATTRRSTISLRCPRLLQSRHLRRLSSRHPSRPPRLLYPTRLLRSLRLPRPPWQMAKIRSASTFLSLPRLCSPRPLRPPRRRLQLLRCRRLKRHSVSTSISSLPRPRLQPLSRRRRLPRLSPLHRHQRGPPAFLL